jgi:hypothetical protein
MRWNRSRMAKTAINLEGNEFILLSSFIFKWFLCIHYRKEKHLFFTHPKLMAEAPIIKGRLKRRKHINLFNICLM